MATPLPAQVNVTPADAAKRRAVAWHGVSAELVQFTGRMPFEYHYQAPAHLFIACDRAIRADGETKVDGLPPSRLHDLGRRMCFIPAGMQFAGSFVPRVLPRVAYFYVAPDALTIDPGLQPDRHGLAPLLFFEDAGLWATAAKLAALIERPETATRLHVETLSTLLALELARLQSGAPAVMQASRGGLGGRQQRIVCQYIEDNLARDISLAELARLAQLSPAYFSRAFKQSLGVSPHQYQLHNRIERAKALLADPHRPIVEVALACGFGYASNFAATFRKLTGTTPTQFRRGFD
jgi:AraC family transcriptional regulator